MHFCSVNPGTGVGAPGEKWFVPPERTGRAASFRGCSVHQGEAQSGKMSHFLIAVQTQKAVQKACPEDSFESKPRSAILYCTRRRVTVQVIEEEELAAIQKQQDEFDRARMQELIEVQRLEAAEKRRKEETVMTSDATTFRRSELACRRRIALAV